MSEHTKQETKQQNRVMSHAPPTRWTVLLVLRGDNLYRDPMRNKDPSEQETKATSRDKWDAGGWM